jgi:RNA-directed DNA polymerase
MDDGKSESASTSKEAGEPTQGTLQSKGALHHMESVEGKTPERRARISVSTKLDRVARRARENPQEVITSLNHLIDVEWLREAFHNTRRDGATGIDGVTAEEYEAALEENLATLLEQFKSGTYRAPPVRRAYIPKGDGSKMRPIGIPTLQDKILQRAVVMLLDAVYEQTFRNCSYGFRRGRSQHQALELVRLGLMRMGGGFVIELDIEKFFDTLDHEHLRNFLDLRVRDGVIRRAIGKWLKAGVLEDGEIERSTEGTPQGGVISPLLANIFLHHVLDEWFEDEIAPRLTGRSFLVRFADDAVIVVEHETDAKRIMDVLTKRLGKYGLKLHPQKTRLVRFKRPRHAEKDRRSDDDDDEPGTFPFLGFTHYWGSTRTGGWAVKRKTERGRVQRTLKKINVLCRRMRHERIAEQHKQLCDRLRGHYNYYGVSSNFRSLAAVCRWVEEIWRYWLNRRSEKRSVSFERFRAIIEHKPLLQPRLSTTAANAARSVW